MVQSSKKSFSLNNYLKNKGEAEESKIIDYSHLVDLKAKIFADIFEALVGATFLASADFSRAINFSLNMLSSNIFQNF